MNNSQTLLLRFKNNIRSASTPAIPEDTETSRDAGKIYGQLYDGLT